MDAQLATLRHGFAALPDPRPAGGQIPLADILMSGLAMFTLKDPSLLAFDERRRHDAANLRLIFGITQAPCDTQMRAVLDLLNPKLLNRSFAPRPTNFSGARHSSNWSIIRDAISSASMAPARLAPRR
jgi:hypothetical protein